MSCNLFLHPLSGFAPKSHWLPRTPFLNRAIAWAALVLFALFASLGAAQQAANEWTWMGGSSILTCIHPYECFSPGVFGTRGVPSSSNLPNGLLKAASWTDQAGNLWLFGGGDHQGLHNDLWRFVPATSEWTWISGSGGANTYGVYGTLGVPSTTNVPGARYDALAWTDQIDNLWLYGGTGYDARGGFSQLNDLWRFDPTTLQWTWMAGSSTTLTCGWSAMERRSIYCPADPHYGPLGEPSVSNLPGGRQGAMVWGDASGNIWIFGGFGASTFPSSYPNVSPLNDLWKFVPSTGEWTWMGGCAEAHYPFISACSSGSAGTFGTLRQPSSENLPSARRSAVGWTDSSGNLWLFGGLGYDANGNQGVLNDLWEFIPSTNQWAWMGGNSTRVCDPSVNGSVTSTTCAGRPGVYGKLGVPDSANIPGSRSNAVAWTDQDGYFWMFGGNFDARAIAGKSSGGVDGYLNDLWELNPYTLNWTWMSGSASPACSAAFSWESSCGQPGVYGVLGTAAPGNVPGSRENSVGWRDGSGNLWLFGGEGYDSAGNGGYGSGDLNDLWTYQPSAPLLPLPTPNFSLSAGTYASIQNVAITDAIPGATIYYTIDGTAPTPDSMVYAGPIPVSSSETIRAIAIAKGYSTSAIASTSYTINLPPALPPVFSPPAGTYTSAQDVVLSDATPGAVIYYTVNGGVPTVESSLYSGPIAVSATETIRAIAVAYNYTDSAIASSEYVLPVTFAIAATPSSLFTAAGGQATTTLTVTPQNGFHSAVSFGCGGLPAGATCSFSPATVTPMSGGSVTTQLTIGTGAMADARHGSGLWLPAFSFGVLLLVWRPRRKAKLRTIVAVLGFGLISVCSGCGSQRSPRIPTVSVITVTGTSGSLQQSMSVSLMVD